MCSAKAISKENCKNYVDLSVFAGRPKAHNYPCQVQTDRIQMTRKLREV